MSHILDSYKAERVTPEFLIGGNKTANLACFSPRSPGSFIVMQFSPWGESHFVMIQCGKFSGKWFTILLSKCWRERLKGRVGIGQEWARLYNYVSILIPKRLTYECKKPFFCSSLHSWLHPCCNHAAPVLSPTIYVCCLLRINLSREIHIICDCF